MTVNKRKKNSRQRGKTTHGWGAKKKHRGAGNRGGRGMAGSGKRADQKKPSILKEYGNTYFGKFGFKIPQKIKKHIKEINISTIENSKSFTAKKEGDFYIINLDSQGYTKLLSKGKPTRKYKITCKSFSKKAIEKIHAAGGETIKCS